MGMGIKSTRTKIMFAYAILYFDSQFLCSNPLDMTKILDISISPQFEKKYLHSERSAIFERHSHGYKIVDSVLRSFYLEFPFFRFINKEWDKKWRIVSYEIPEQKREMRDRLRREMIGWGFGSWHRSFWISPHPVISDLASYVARREESQYIQGFEGDYVIGDSALLLEKVWDVRSLEKQYRGMFSKWHLILSSRSDKKEKFKGVVNEYVNVLKIDPGLPKDVVGNDWIGFEAWSMFKQIRGALFGF